MSSAAPLPIAATERRSGYVEGDRLVMYHQIHGGGRLGVSHGAPMTLEQPLPDLAKDRRIIAILRQAHGGGRPQLPDEQAASRVPPGAIWDCSALATC